jgi:MIP family channel proteins
LRQLARLCLGELLGTFILVALGISVVAVSVLGLWELSSVAVAALWGAAVALAIYASRPFCAAHLNPAVTLSLVLRRRWPLAHLLPHWAAQLLGAMAAGALVATLFRGEIAEYERRLGLTRGLAGSERSAMIFGEYFPNPALFGTGSQAEALVSPALAATVEGLGTAVLLFVVFALASPAAVRLRACAPLLIGATVALLIYLFAPITQAGWNPARDLGPRLVAFALGWGDIALPGPRAGFWIYIVGPLIGGPVGGLTWDLLARWLSRQRQVGAAAALPHPPGG